MSIDIVYDHKIVATKSVDIIYLFKIAFEFWLNFIEISGHCR